MCGGGKGGFMKTFVIISLVILILGAAGGGAYYYYTESYLPMQYARVVLPIYEKFRSPELTSDAGIKDAADADGALRVIEARRRAGKEIQDALAKITPPKKMAVIHTDFSRLITLASAANDHSETLLRFFQKVPQLRAALKTSREPPPAATAMLRPETATVSILQEHWGEPLEKSVALGSELFGGPVPDFMDSSLADLKSSWSTVGPDIEFVRGLVMSFAPTMPLAKIESTIPRADNQRAEKALREVEEFEKKLGAVLEKMNARDIAGGRYFWAPRRSRCLICISASQRRWTT